MNTQATNPDKPAVLFVCVKNGGKSQMAAGLMTFETGHAVNVSSAGTRPGKAINDLSAEVLLGMGIDITHETPQALTEEMMRSAGLVIVLGDEAQVVPVEGVDIEIWQIDEPSLRGVEGRERMELVRDDIHARVKQLAQRLLTSD